MSAEPYFPRIGDVVKFTGGKYNGFDGEVKLIASDGTCAVQITYDHKPFTVIEHFGFLKFIAGRAEQVCHKPSLWLRIRRRLFSF